MEQSKNLTELLELMQEHPELPVIPIVNTEIIADGEYGYWVGSWGGSRVDKFWIGEERVHFYEEDDWEGVDYDGADIGIEDDVSDEEIARRYENLPWTEAIVVYIELPDI